MTGISEIIAGAIKPVTDLIGKFITKDEDKAKVMVELEKTKNDLQTKILEYQTENDKASKEVIIAEVQGKSWLQRNWRPVLMLSITAILVNNYILFPYLSAIFPKYMKVLDFPPEFWTLLTVAVGGYIGGRTVEKVYSQKGGTQVVGGIAEGNRPVATQNQTRDRV